MTPKEKANELMRKYSNIDIDIFNLNLKMFGNEVLYYSGSLVEKSAKQCALIAVDELIKFGNDQGIREPMMYWHKVKEELEKL
jgi:hypothetical protein